MTRKEHKQRERAKREHEEATLPYAQDNEEPCNTLLTHDHYGPHHYALKAGHKGECAGIAMA